MYNNGVSHLTAKDDITGVTAILQWLSYVAWRSQAGDARRPAG